MRTYYRVLLVLCLCCSSLVTADAKDLQLLFMGDNGHHRPAERFQELAPVLETRGIRMKYTDRMEDLTPEVLQQFDGLVLYANIDRIEDAQELASFARCVPCKINIIEYNSNPFICFMKSFH